LTNDVALAGSPAFANMPLVNFGVLSLLRKQYGKFFKPVQKLRTKLGLPRGKNPLWNEAHSELLQLCLWPEKFGWSYTHHNRVYCGFPFLHNEEKIAPDIEAFLKAGDQLNYLLANKQAIRSRVDIHDASSLQNGTLYFNNSNAPEIARKLTRYYNVKVDVAASAHKHHRFSGEMKDYGVTKLLDGLRFATGIKYKVNNQNSILLY
ncbi:MAG: DUF4974 domain-containing protein, partial [Sphingobacteriales bacterium]